MLTFVLISGLAGAAVLVVAPRVTAVGILTLVGTAAGPFLLGLQAVAEVVLGGLAAVGLALFFRAVHEFILASSDAKVREIVRNVPRRVPPL